MILYICNTAAVGLFGIILSAAFCNIRWDRKNVLWMAAATVAIYILQAVVYFGIDTTQGQYLYPIHTHLTLAIVRCVLSRQRLWPVISVLTAYLCCQLRRWLALVIVAVFSGGDRMQYIAEMALTIPLLILLLRLLFDPDISGQLAGAAVVFCLSLIALYSASSVYHFSLRGEAVLRRLKKLDHSMIYVLIAGSYTPIILKFMPAPRSFLFLGVIWLIALTGIAVKLLWIDAPRLIGTALYLALGWAIAFDFGVVLSMPSPAIALLAAGGLAYTAGGIIYISKRPNFSTLLGFHELFHLFVIVGSICHYLMVMLYVL